MGLPGSGKTYLAERLQKVLKCAWYNANDIRMMACDWDFTIEGRIRQSNRMKTIADFEKSKSLMSWPGPFPPLFGRLKCDSEAGTPHIICEIQWGLFISRVQILHPDKKRV